MGTELTDALLELLAHETNGFDSNRFAQDLAARAVVLGPARDAGVLLRVPGDRPEIVAGTGSAPALVRFQLEHGEGPAAECLHSGSSSGGPWPRFSAACAEAGYSSVHTVPIAVGGDVFGALCLFDCGGDAERTARPLARAAALRLIQQRDLQQLRTALDSRIVIEQAKGMLAERYKIGVDTAFEGLRRYARDHNQRVADLARAIVDGGDPVRFPPN